MQKIAPFAAMAVGVVLALATSAFNKVPKNKSGDTLYTFQYNAPVTNPYSQTNVENKANWSYTAGTPSCDDNDQQACSFEVSSNSVDIPTMGDPTLKSSFSITAQEYDPSDYYVGSTSDNDATIVNKSL
ncbi:hypothetical protein D6B99_16455 [Arachidicoccus soli]|uniref:Uncharacterized protein n=2 Tax=Arachidicoccus soli TaxID=2341117 RepID=A0A386HSV9_9BACT|nr:hypothetical protein D6B99_16455 [Arachidicoccus soli]